MMALLYAFALLACQEEDPAQVLEKAVAAQKVRLFELGVNQEVPDSRFAPPK